MAKEIAFENGRISNFRGLVVHHSLTSTYTPNFIKIKETFCGRTYARTYVHTYGHLRPSLLGRLCRTVDLKITVDHKSCTHKYRAYWKVIWIIQSC